MMRLPVEKRHSCNEEVPAPSSDYIKQQIVLLTEQMKDEKQLERIYQFVKYIYIRS